MVITSDDLAGDQALGGYLAPVILTSPAFWDAKDLRCVPGGDGKPSPYELRGSGPPYAPGTLHGFFVRHPTDSE